MTATVVGLASSIILLLTITRQVYTQWKSRSTEGMSRWLFIGQLVASVGFAAYAWMLQNWIFLTTNLMLIVAALVGQLIYVHNRKHADAGGAAKH